MYKFELTSSIEYKQVSSFEKKIEFAKDFFNNHSKALIFTGIALMALGKVKGSIGPASFILPHISVPLVGNRSIISIMGVSILFSVGIKWRQLLFYLIAVRLLSAIGIQWTSSMPLNRFEARNCLFNGKLLGNLHYENSLPVLELNTEDHYEMGLAQGFLLGAQIKEAYHDVLTPMIRLAGVLSGDFSGKFFRQQITQITIPEPYRTEIKGIIEGAKEWAKQRGVAFNMTEDQLLEANKLADAYKAIGLRIMGILNGTVFGCSTAVIKKGNEVAVCRTLDWPSLGKMGELSYIKKYKANGKRIEMLTYIGIIGALTAFNDKGLVAVINENSTISQKGVPYAILSRQIIEKNASVDEAEAMISNQDYNPASSHHLTLVDPKRAAIYQMVLENNCPYLKRELDFSQERAFIVVTNHTIREGDTILERTICEPKSKARYSKMTQVLTAGLEKNDELIQLVRDSLQSVNVLDTVATAQFYLDIRENKMKSNKYTYNNYWAAKTI